VKLSERDPGQELLMNPVDHMTPVPTLNFAPSIAEGDVATTLAVQPGTLFIQESVNGHNERPETQDGGGIHELVLVETQQVFGITEQDLDVPTGI